MKIAMSQMCKRVTKCSQGQTDVWLLYWGVGVHQNSLIWANDSCKRQHQEDLCPIQD
jgi:hypothetical protein